MHSQRHFGVQTGARIWRRAWGLGSEGATWEGAGRRVVALFSEKLDRFLTLWEPLRARGGAGPLGRNLSPHSSASTGSSKEASSPCSGENLASPFHRQQAWGSGFLSGEFSQLSPKPRIPEPNAGTAEALKLAQLIQAQGQGWKGYSRPGEDKKRRGWGCRRVSWDSRLVLCPGLQCLPAHRRAFALTIPSSTRNSLPLTATGLLPPAQRSPLLKASPHIPFKNEIPLPRLSLT